MRHKRSSDVLPLSPQIVLVSAEFDDHFFQLSGGDAEGLVLSFDETDAARQERRDKVDHAHLIGRTDKILWNNADPEAGFDHRENLIGGKGLEIRTGSPWAAKKPE